MSESKSSAAIKKRGDKCPLCGSNLKRPSGRPKGEGSRQVRVPLGAVNRVKGLIAEYRDVRKQEILAR